MVETLSTMLPLGTPCPSFRLPNAAADDESLVSPQDFQGCKALLVMFLCNHCPYVVHVRDEVTRYAREYQPKGVGIVAINSNSVTTHPQDGPAAMKEMARQQGWSFPFLFDATQEVARAFHAACTPEFYLFDAQGKLVYRGQFDDSRPKKPTPVTGKDLRAATDAVLEGRPVAADQRPSVGCNIKWHPA